MGLDTYFLDKNNLFDPAIDKLITDIKTQMETISDEMEGWDSIKEDDPERYAELEDQMDQSGTSILEQQRDATMDMIYLQDQLIALMEMKIVYAVKSLEINISRLLRAAFYTNQRFHQWTVVVEFMKGKGIQVNKLDGYTEINQLRSVNNAIKHSGEVDESTKNIPEFERWKVFSSRSLGDFYERISRYPSIFLKSLIAAIHSELYVFSDSKLDEMTRSIVLRMNKEDALKFARKILAEYGDQK